MTGQTIFPGVHGTVTIRCMDGSSRFTQAVMNQGRIRYIIPSEDWWNPQDVYSAEFSDQLGAICVPVCPCCGGHTLIHSESMAFIGAMECPSCGYCDSDGGADTDREPMDPDI